MQSQILNKSYALEQQEENKHYEPIQFIFTQTIGSVNQKMKEILDPYIWTYQDILLPKTINNHNFIYYYMFHISPIYNWLRQVPSKQTALLKQYILQNNNKSVATMNSLLKANPVNTKSSKQLKFMFDKSAFEDSLKKYVAKWEVAKLCATMKISIKTTRQADTSKNAQLKCTHLIKTQQSTLNYIFSHITKTIECNKVYCQQCQKYVDIVCDIIKYPFAPIFKQFHGDTITFKMMNKSQSIAYNPVMAFSKQFTYMKCANRVWYEIANGLSRTISYDRIDFKKAQLVVYQNCTAILDNRKVLRLAQPVKLKELEQQQQNFNRKKIRNKQIQQEQYHQENALKLKQKKDKKAQPYKAKTNQNPMQLQQQKPQALEQLKKQAPVIILNKKKVDTQVYRQYKDKIQSLFDKPKAKDQYELDYDKGKTKKIKKKIDYIRPDFFNLYKDIQVEKSYGRPYGDQQEQYQKKERKGSDEQQFSKRQKKKYHGSTSNKFQEYPKKQFKNTKRKN